MWNVSIYWYAQLSKYGAKSKKWLERQHKPQIGNHHKMNNWKYNIVQFYFTVFYKC